MTPRKPVSSRARKLLAADLQSTIAGFTHVQNGAVHPELLESVSIIDDPTPPPIPGFSWASKPGIISPARDQRPCNACTSFAVCACIEARHKIARQSTINLAPGFIHTCLGHGLDCSNSFDPLTALQRIQQYGIAYGFDGDYPYPATSCGTASRYPVGQSRQLRGPNDAKFSLLQRGPIMAMMVFGDDFLAHAGSQPYRLPPPPAALHPHCVSVIGYDDNQGCWIIQNSFGPRWGINGCGSIAYGACGLLLPPGTPTPGNIPCGAFETLLAPPLAA